MFLETDLASESVARLKRSRVNTAQLNKRLCENERSRFASDEQREMRLRSLMAQAGDPIAARTMLERVLGGNDLVGVNSLAIGALRCRSVCRIHLRDRNGNTTGFGTGFLVGPGVLMTNHHVIAGAEDARGSSAEFDYEYDLSGHDKPMASFDLLADPEPLAFEPLDFCLVAVAPRSSDGARSLAEFGWLTLNPLPGKAIVGEYLTIVQHPGGERKQVCVRENKLLKYDDNGSTLWYHTDTVAGSSGSPVFNLQWDVVALHHSSVPATNADGRWLTVDGKVWDASMGEDRVKWTANEGIRISAISEYLRARAAANPLARPVVTPQAGPMPERGEYDGSASGDGTGYANGSGYANGGGYGSGGGAYGHGGYAGGGSSTVHSAFVGNELRMTIPIRVAVRVGTDWAAPAASASAPAPAAASSPKLLGPGSTLVLPSGTEAVTVDQTNYARRTGYQPDFLGDGDLLVPLPSVAKAALKRQVLVSNGTKANGELRYWTYSVVMNKARKLAFFTAANVDADKRPDGAGRDGDRWYADTRIDAKFQLGAEFYGRQREFEADRGQNPFDRGHLTRRLDAQWGSSAGTAKRNGDDSFHWTNCSPQFWRFNQGAKKWLGLEDYVIDGFARNGGRRACVINGPVFDAPLSRLDAGGRVVPNLDGRAHKDPKFGGISIPKQFFKVVACARPEGSLAVAAFLMSQEDLLVTVDRIQGMPDLPQEKLTNAEAKLYQVRLTALAELTGLDFGPLTPLDTTPDEKAEDRIPRRIERLEDVRLA